MAYTFSTAPNEFVLAVWQKGAPIDDYAAAVWRRDICGNVMKFDQHGEEGEHGWEIDHVNPTANGGGDNLANLQPLWWTNNRTKSDTYPWACP